MSRLMPAGWAIPALSAFNRAFFTSGKLVLQECAACGNVQHPPEEVCYGCLAMDFQPREASGLGTIHSFIVIHYPVAQILAGSVPYTVVLVSLDDFPSVRVVGNVLNRLPDEVDIGQRVKAVFEEIASADGSEVILLPQWEVLD